MDTGNRSKIVRGWVWLFVFVWILSGCSAGGSLGNSSGKVLQSQVQRDLNPAAAQSDLDRLSRGNRAFALDHYQLIRREPGNIFYSPYSISTALAMTFAGARGRTELQMAEVLHFDLPQEALHPAFNALDLKLSSSAAQTAQDAPQPFRLDIANSIWGQTDHPFKPEFLDLLALNYNAGLRLADFAGAPEESRREINAWVEQKTQEKIQNLIPQGGITPDTRLVLANAIYFKADWLHPFEKNNTHDQPFYLADGTQIAAPAMSFEHSEILPYFAGDGFQAAALPYAGETTRMLILVPDAGKLTEFESGLTSAKLEQILARLEPVELRLVLPKFEFTAEYQLSDHLKELGMPDAFCDGQADFSGMDEDGNLCIDEVFHKAFVAVDEKGTEAAAASAVVMQEAAAVMDESLFLIVDRPFLFLIQHEPSGTILFMGRLLDPRPSS